MTELSTEETLNETIGRMSAKTTSKELDIIIAGLITQRTRWNLEQQKGSRKRTPSNKIVTKPGSEKPKPKPKPKSEGQRLAMGLKKIVL